MRPIIIAAGGTGGHFFPAEALAATLIARGHRVVLMTDGRSGALKSAVFAGREQHVLKGAGIAGRGVLGGVLALASLAAGTAQSRQLLRQLDASVLVGFGGYPSVPPVLAARTLARKPAIILHEQNAVLGRANRFLSRFADVLALGFAETARCPAGKPGELVGNPVRSELQALTGHGYTASSGDFRLLVLGGSLGARVLSDVVPAALAALTLQHRRRLRVTQQCRQEDLERVRSAYSEAGIAANLSPFFKDVAGLLAASHLVIARAGASTCAELAVAGRPSILVPLPGAIDDHQTSNARALAQGGGAEIIAQPAFTLSALAEKIAHLLDDGSGLSQMAAAAASHGRPDAASHLADLVERYAVVAEVSA